MVRQIVALPWRDRLMLLWHLIKSFLPFQPPIFQTSSSYLPPLSASLAELQQICIEENYTLHIPSRMDRANPFTGE